MRHLVVLNPMAGGGGGGNIARRLDKVFRARKLDYEVVLTEGRGHATALIRMLGGDFDSVISAGGDGTVYEVLQGLDFGRHRLGIVPLGTGNDFAWMLQWPKGLEASADRIQSGNTRRVDVGTWKGTDADGERRGRFLNTVGLGFEATVNLASHRISNFRGPAVYILALLRSLRRFRSYPVEIFWPEGNRVGSVSFLAVANGARVGGCFHIAPGAIIDDAKLDLVLADEMNLLRAMMMAPRFMNGSHLRRQDVKALRTTRVGVGCAEGIPAYADGEFLGRAFIRLDMEILPGALTTF